METAELIKRREALKMSREELASALNTTMVTIWRWEKGERAIPPYLSLALETVERQQGQEGAAEASPAIEPPAMRVAAPKKAKKKGSKK